MSGYNTKCVIFDCDGTLIDSEKLRCQALVNIFTQLGAEYSLSQALSHYQGGKTADILSSVRDYLNVSTSIDRLEGMYRQQLEFLFNRELEAMPGVANVLDHLEDLRIEYCVAGNAPIAQITQSLKKVGLYEHFEGKIFSAFDTNSWKPEPDLVRYSAMMMGFKLEDCLYVDDTPKGIEAGVRAGVRSVQLVNEHSTLYSRKVASIRYLTELKSLINVESLRLYG